MHQNVTTLCKESPSYALTSHPLLLRILLLQQPRNRLQLNVTRPLINRPNLTIPKHLLRDPLPHEPHPAHPLNRLPTDPPRNLTRKKLRHCRILHEIQTRLLLPRRIIDERPRGADLRVRLRELVLHALELADEAVELPAVVPDILGGVLPRAEGEAGHLCGDADAAFVQEADGVFVALAFGAEELVGGDVDVVEVDDAGAAGADAELFLLFGDGEAFGAFLDDEGRDALVAFAGVEVGEDDEEVGFDGVGDPHL